jgi:hypothetical protein
MKSAYELAMERLQKATPSVVLSDEQKKQIADLVRGMVKIADGRSS